MIYNLSTTIKDREGVVLQENGKDITIARMIINALDLGAVAQGKEQLKGEEKARRFILGTRIYASPSSVDLTPEEVVICKEVIGDTYAPLVVGQVYESLNNPVPNAS